MTFELRGNGGNHAGAEWIAAEGDIEDETADDLNSFMKRFGHTENPGGWSVRFNSPGGDLAGGIRLGELIRKLRLDTEIGGTEPDEFHWKRVPGRCASASAFAFLGGLTRSASGGELGVHQFYDEISIRHPSAKVFDSLDMSNHQLISAMLIDYVFRMGVDPRLVSIAASTPPRQMEFLDEQTLDDLNVRWFPKEFQPWSIEPNGGGVSAVTRSKDRTRIACISYSADGIPRLTIEDSDPKTNSEWLNNALAEIRSVVAFDREFRRDAVKARISDGILIVEFTLQGIDGKAIATSRWPGVSVDGPRYMLGPFTYILPTKNADIAVSIAAKNCVTGRRTQSEA